MSQPDTNATKLTNYFGSCHCKNITFKVDLDLSKGTGICNCSICFKTRNWEARTTKEHFTILTCDKENLGDYVYRDPNFHHYFCKKCGTKTHITGFIEELGGEFLCVHVNTLDNVTQEEFSKLNVQYFDGADDKWEQTPQYTNHL